MSQSATTSRGLKLWLVGGIGLLWNAMGVVNFARQMNAGTLASMPAEQRAIIEIRPTWATIAFAIGVIAGLLGCLLLLLRRHEALPILGISLVAIAVHMLAYFRGPSISAAVGPSGILFFVILPLAVAGFLVWFAGKARFA